MPQNRLGMIVCGAFLGLLAAVITAKMREPEGDAPSPEKALAAVAPAPVTEPAVTPPVKSEDAPGLPPPMLNTDSVPLIEPKVSTPARPADGPFKDPTHDSAPPIVLPEPQVALNDHPAHSEGVTPAGVNLPAPINETAPKSAPTDAAVAPPPPPGPMLELPPPPPPAPPTPGPSTGATEPALPLPLPISASSDEEKKKNADSLPKDHSKDDKDIKKPEGAKGEKDAPPLFPPNNSTGEPPAPPSPMAENKNDPAPAKVKIPAPLVPPAPAPEPVPNKGDAPLPPFDSSAPKQDKVTVVIPAPSGPPRIEPPPFVPSSASRPIAPTPPNGAPLVDSWDERTYTARTGDTFAAISQSEYKTEDYAKALQMYNQNHPRAGDAMRRDGALAPGDRVYLPPSPILEKRHADVIVRSKPKPVTAGTVGGDGFGGAVQAEFHTPVSRPANPTYKVQGVGEPLYKIAAEQLHDGNRWREIATLNPRASTDGAVLGGTILQMPSPSANAAPPLPGS